jgi:hypothetical protein
MINDQWSMISGYLKIFIMNDVKRNKDNHDNDQWSMISGYLIDLPELQHPVRFCIPSVFFYLYIGLVVFAPLLLLNNIFKGWKSI